MTNEANQERQVSRIQSYYRFQSKIYDWTRWSFLFGRRTIVKALPFRQEDRFHLLEIGCGTGSNLAMAAKLYPAAQLTGMDVSADMLRIAQGRLKDERKINLLEQPYRKTYYTWTGKLDAVLFSYSLTMINPQWKELLEQALTDLRPGGVIAVVDFHFSRHQWFRRHMSNHHVRMEKHLIPELADLFKVEISQVRSAYLGVWEYMLFVGRKK